MICALTLAGCAGHNLPYTITIGDPSGGKSVVSQEDCVLHLDNIVEKVSEDTRSSKLTIKLLQKQFEEKLSKDTQALKNCNNGNGESVIEEVAKKWLTTYALDATDPDQTLDRFREYVRSAELMESWAQHQIKPDETEFNATQVAKESQSQWCGTALPNGSSCDEKRSLYHTRTVLTSPYPGETAKDLYKHLLSDIVQVERGGTQRNQRYFMLGYEIPWDDERTLVRYGVTFYFREEEPELGQLKPVQLIGYDLTYANEATPNPPTKKREATPDPPTQKNPELLPWLTLDNALRSTGYPFSFVIGVKNAVFEIAKTPFSLIAGVLIGRDPLNYPVENGISARDVLDMEILRLPPSSWGAVWGFYRLLTEVPLVGQLFQYNFGSDDSEPDNLTPNIRPKIFLSRGIYGGNKWGQDTGLWTLFTRQEYPTHDVYSPSYGHGTAIDVVWSMFNLSHGPAYNEARYVMDYATPEDRLYLAGHSGGVQRSVAASRILSNFGYRVIKVVGIAGPSIGQAVVDTRYPEAFKEYLNTGAGDNQDFTSKIGNVAGVLTTILDYGVIVPLKYTVGSLAGVATGDLNRAYRVADRFGFSNVKIVEVERKPSSRHQTPMRLSFTDRLVFDSYIRNEFSTAFRDDLERADTPEADRPHAFPWKP
jgi:hypothetical protein